MDMSWVKNFDMPILPMVALFMFLFLFIGILIWTFKKSNIVVFKNGQNLPLEDGVKL